mgnify:CR=1 FL=1
MRTFKFLNNIDPIDDRAHRFIERVRQYESLVYDIIRQNPLERYMYGTMKWFVEDGSNKHLQISGISEWGLNRDVINIFYKVHTHNLFNPTSTMEYRLLLTRDRYNQLKNENI